MMLAGTFFLYFIIIITPVVLRVYVFLIIFFFCLHSLKSYDNFKRKFKKFNIAKQYKIMSYSKSKEQSGYCSLSDILTK